MTVLILAAASILILFAASDVNKWRSGNVDYFVVVWIIALAAWPSFITYFLAPLIWTGADQSGSLFPAMQYAPAALMSCVAFWQGLRNPRSEINIPAAILGTLFFFSAVGIFLEGRAQLLNLAVTIALFVGVLLRTKPVNLQSVGLGAIASIAVMSLSTTVTTAVNGGVTTGTCRVDKCNALGEALTSPFAGNGNSLGLAIVLLTPFALAVTSPIRSIALIGGVVAVQEFASSRTATIGLAAAVVTVCLVRLVPLLWAKIVVASLSVLLGFAISLFPLYKDFAGSAFSFRGYLWDEAEKLIELSPVFGHGPTYWSVLARSALFDANYSPHNGWFDILVSLGFWGALVIGIAVFAQLRMTAPETRPYLLGYYSCVLSISAFESVFVPYYLGITPFVAILPLILYDPVKSRVTSLASHITVDELNQSGVAREGQASVSQ